MRNSKQIIGFLLILTILVGCRKKEGNFIAVRNLDEYHQTDFVPTLENGISKDRNSIYCVTFLYAWDEIRSKIGAPIQIKQSLSDLTLINNSRSFVESLKEEEYTATGIIEGNSIVAKAEFRKSLPFDINLISYNHKLQFAGTWVESFGLRGHDYNRTQMVEIKYYQNDDNFILALHPKDKDQEIILFKSENRFHTLAEMCSELDKLSVLGSRLKDGENNWRYCIRKEDDIIIPKINFDIQTNYKSIVGNTFHANKNEYNIGTAWQRTAFDFNEKGAEIESEAEAYVTIALEKEEIDKPRPKTMKFDKPFLLILKRKDSAKPYFAIWITNPELMRLD
jgi:hypothetical protein